MRIYWIMLFAILLISHGAVKGGEESSVTIERGLPLKEGMRLEYMITLPVEPLDRELTSLITMDTHKPSTAEPTGPASPPISRLPQSTVPYPIRITINTIGEKTIEASFSVPKKTTLAGLEAKYETTISFVEDDWNTSPVSFPKDQFFLTNVSIDFSGLQIEPRTNTVETRINGVTVVGVRKVWRLPQGAGQSEAKEVSVTTSAQVPLGVTAITASGIELRLTAWSNRR